MGNKRDGLTVEQAAVLFGLFADPNRLRIVFLLAQKGEIQVGELSTRLGLSQPAVSSHLKRLRMTRVAEFRREGHRHYYRLSAHVAADLLRFLRDRQEPELPK
jgi:DNA-binding transcriptional ArsR family regulator